MVAFANEYVPCVSPSGLLTVKLKRAGESPIGLIVPVYSSPGQNIKEVVPNVSDLSTCARSNEKPNAVIAPQSCNRRQMD